MKVNIFYSWQSDLPNNKNRNLIGSCINKSLKSVFANNKEISEYVIESDSRSEVGTPDLVESIFSKIDLCDIFICDISIVNNVKGSEKIERLMPNPNVMIELGYAAKSIGWSNIICVFNKEFSKIEELPFDIRLRKPIAYDTSNDSSIEKKNLVKLLEQSISDVFEQRLSDKRHYKKTKRTVDLGMQAILIDFTKLLYSDCGKAEQYNYPRLLNSTIDEIKNIVKGKSYLGFKLFKNITRNIDEFSDFFNDGINTYFLSEKERKIIIKTIYALQDYKDILDVKNLTPLESNKNNYKIISGYEMNPSNPSDSYILLESIDAEKGIVKDSGAFEKRHLEYLLKWYSIPEKFELVFINLILNIVNIVNEWIRTTGNYFIINERLLDSKSQIDISSIEKI